MDWYGNIKKTTLVKFKRLWNLHRATKIFAKNTKTVFSKSIISSKSWLVVLKTIAHTIMLFRITRLDTNKMMVYHLGLYMDTKRCFCICTNMNAEISIKRQKIKTLAWYYHVESSLMLKLSQALIKYLAYQEPFNILTLLNIKSWKGIKSYKKPLRLQSMEIQEESKNRSKLKRGQQNTIKQSPPALSMHWKIKQQF